MQACFAYSTVDLPLNLQFQCLKLEFIQHASLFAYSIVDFPLNLPFQSLLSSKIEFIQHASLGITLFFLTVLFVFCHFHLVRS